MEKETITDVLIIEHGKMRDLLARFIRAIERGAEESKETFDLFEKKEKSHVKIEEKDLFALKEIKISIVETLISQHQAIGEIRDNIKEMLKNEEDPTELALKLQELLRKHTDLEEEKFYKILD